MKQFSQLIMLAILLLSSTWSLAANNSGAQNYQRYCAQCHGQDGRNVLPTAANFKQREGLRKSNKSLFEHIRLGKQSCPGFIGILQDQEILDVINHIRKLGR